MTTLYHATSREKADLILSEGMRAGSYWAEDDIAAYYAETVEDEGEEPVILTVQVEDLLALSPEAMSPDLNGIDEPLTFTLRATEDEVRERWDASDRSWEASLEIIRSVRFHAPIPADLICEEKPDCGDEPDADY